MASLGPTLSAKMLKRAAGFSLVSESVKQDDTYSSRFRLFAIRGIHVALKVGLECVFVGESESSELSESARGQMYFEI